MKDLILTIIIAFMLAVCLIDIVHDTYIYHKRRKAEQRRLLRRHEKAMQLQALADKQREVAAATEKAQDAFDKLTENAKEFARVAREAAFIPASDETKVKVEDELANIPVFEVDGIPNVTSDEEETPLMVRLTNSEECEAFIKAKENELRLEQETAAAECEKPDVADERLYTLTEIEPIVGLAHRTLVKYVNEGRIKATKIDRVWRVRESDLQAFINETAVVELCPYCEEESVFPNWNVEKQGYVAKCQHCGKEIFLCDECQHAKDNKGGACDWQKVEFADGGFQGRCFRGVTHNNHHDEDIANEENKN